MSAVAGIDIALWDLKGKALGVPVYELLGGPTRDRVRVYVHLRGTTAEELVEDALAREAGFTALRFGCSARRSPTGTRRPRSWRRCAGPRRCARRSATRSTCCSTRTRCSRRRGRVPWRRARAGAALLLRGPDPAAQPDVAEARARQGQPPDRDRRAARAQVGVPAADRGRAARLPPHRPRPRGRHHRGEEDPRDGRGARPALGPAPHERAGQRGRVPARRRRDPELRHPGVGRARAAVRPLPRTRRARRPGTSRCRPGRGSGWSSTRRRRASGRRGTRGCRSATAPTGATRTTEYDRGHATRNARPAVRRSDPQRAKPIPLDERGASRPWRCRAARDRRCEARPRREQPSSRRATSRSSSNAREAVPLTDQLRINRREAYAPVRTSSALLSETLSRTSRPCRNARPAPRPAARRASTAASTNSPLRASPPRPLRAWRPSRARARPPRRSAGRPAR